MLVQTGQHHHASRHVEFVAPDAIAGLLCASHVALGVGKLRRCCRFAQEMAGLVVKEMHKLQDIFETFSFEVRMHDILVQ